MTQPILVTGAHGRIGRALWRVDAGAHSLVGWGGPRAIGPDRAVDITDPADVRLALSEVNPRAVIHLASALGAACDRDPVLAEAVNVAGTVNLARAARERGVERIVFASTAAVYGTGLHRPASERDPLDAAGVYASTKLRAERVLAGVSDALAIDVMRVFNVYGPEMAESLVGRLARSTEAAPALLSGLDGFVRDYVHVDDVARALLTAADSSSAGYRVLNVGTGQPRSNRDLLEALPARTRATVEIGPELDSYSCADISAIVRELSWGPVEPWPPFGGEASSFTTGADA